MRAAHLLLDGLDSVTLVDGAHHPARLRRERRVQPAAHVYARRVRRGSGLPLGGGVTTRDVCNVRNVCGVRDVCDACGSCNVCACRTSPPRRYMPSHAVTCSACRTSPPRRYMPSHAVTCSACRTSPPRRGTGSAAAGSRDPSNPSAAAAPPQPPRPRPRRLAHPPRRTSRQKDPPAPLAGAMCDRSELEPWQTCRVAAGSSTCREAVGSPSVHVAGCPLDPLPQAPKPAAAGPMARATEARRPAAAWSGERWWRRGVAEAAGHRPASCSGASWSHRTWRARGRRLERSFGVSGVCWRLLSRRNGV